MGRTIVLLAIEEGHVVLLDCCDESGVLAVLDRPECALDCARSSERTGERAETKQTHARVLRERRARQYGDRSYLRRVHNLRTVGAQTVLLHESRTVSSPAVLAERGDSPRSCDRGPRLPHLRITGTGQLGSKARGRRTHSWRAGRARRRQQTRRRKRLRAHEGRREPAVARASTGGVRDSVITSRHWTEGGKDARAMRAGQAKADLLRPVAGVRRAAVRGRSVARGGRPAQDSSVRIRSN